MMHVPVSGKWLAKIDDDDYKYVREFQWVQTGKGNYIYPCANVSINGKIRPILLHRLVLGVQWESGVIVDHINGDRFDARKQNLRKCNHGQNISNQRHRTHHKTSQFHGVYFDKHHGKWIAEIRHNKKKFVLGRFHNEVDAAKCYDKGAIVLHAEFASLNFT